MSDFVSIALDGGAASGKSTAARTLSAKRNLLHVDTGSHYRLLSYGILQENISLYDARALQQFLDDLHLGVQVNGTTALITWHEATPENTNLRSAAVNNIVSPVAAIPEVRDVLKSYQRSLVQVAQEKGFAGIIMEGRDIGSVILPDADFRFFFFASAEARQKRREAEGITDSIMLRDRIDSERKTAPLTCPDGAIRLDTGALSREQVIEAVESHIPSWKK